MKRVGTSQGEGREVRVVSKLDQKKDKRPEDGEPDRRDREVEKISKSLSLGNRDQEMVRGTVREKLVKPRSPTDSLRIDS